MSKQCNMQDYDWLIKVIVMGDSGVGKTNILSIYTTSLGCDVNIKIINVKGKKLKLQLWDTAGQERFRNITNQYIKGSQGAILVYSINDRRSFQHIDGWIRQIQEKVDLNDIQQVLVGNKVDMTAERQVTFEEGMKLSRFYGIPFFETSAKNNINIDEAFLSLGSAILSSLDKGEAIDDDRKLLQVKSKHKTCC